MIDKLETVAKRHGLSDPSPNTFLLVDEGHRSHYGETAARLRPRRGQLADDPREFFDTACGGVDVGPA